MILIIDFGSQTAHLIGRRLRQLGIPSRYAYPENVLEAIKEKPSGIILSGGPASVYEPLAPSINQTLFSLNIPILGICYGWQLMAYQLGGRVKSTTKEYGKEQVTIVKQVGIFDLPLSSFSAIMSHGDSVTTLPEGFFVCASTAHIPYAGVSHDNNKLFGVQFHPEADHTEQGIEILKKFAVTICGETELPFRLDPKKIIDDICHKVKKNKVIMAVSGGVDSSVAAYLIGKAIGKQLIPVYVESGFMRPGTLERVKHLFSTLIQADLIVVDAKKRFMDALKGVTDAEKKRKIIGKLYVDIFQEVAKLHRDASFLGQGTIYSDVIESKGSKHASQIKSHHNVGGLPKDMKLELLEPMRNYYKDEVREIGKLSGLPESVVMQQPVPGPGYAINIMGEVTDKRLLQVTQADSIVVEEMKKANLYSTVFECFAVMTGAFSTAVKGDGRVFAEVVAIRSVDTKDIMTSEWSRIPHEVLARISSRIVNEVPHVSRVVYDITSKPPATIRWE